MAGTTIEVPMLAFLVKRSMIGRLMSLENGGYRNRNTGVEASGWEGRGGGKRGGTRSGNRQA